MFEPVASWSLPEHLFQVSRVVGQVHEAQRSRQLPEPDTDAGTEAAPERRQAPGRLARHADLRVDRPDVPPAPAEGLVGLLRREGNRARLHERLRAHVHPGPPEREDAGHLEPVALLRHRQQRQPARQHQVGRQLLQGREERHAARGVVGRAVGPGERAPALVGERRAVVRHEPRERGDEEPRLELDGDLPRVGRLGRPLRPRRAARPSTRTATGCACRGS